MKVRSRAIVACAAATFSMFQACVGLAQQAQPGSLVCYLAPGSPSPVTKDWVDWFLDGLRQKGLTDGVDVRVLIRHTDGYADRLPDMARQMAADGCRVIVTRGTTAVRAVHLAAPAIPIVMAGSADPVAMGFAQSLARPGGNVTGVSILGADLIGKRIEILKEAVPSTRVVAAFLQGANPGNDVFRAALTASAQALDIAVHVRDIHAPEEFEAAFDWASRIRADGVFLIQDPMFLAHRAAIFRIAEKRRLPVVGGNVELGPSGALVVYALSEQAIARDAARFVADILRGADPAGLPIIQAATFRLVVNLRTARAIGIAVPESVLARADEVIE